MHTDQTCDQYRHINLTDDDLEGGKRTGECTNRSNTVKMLTASEA